MYIFAIVVGIITAVTAYLVSEYRRYHLALKNVPGPPPKFFVGNILAFKYPAGKYNFFKEILILIFGMWLFYVIILTAESMLS